jgi:hypothetical protein
MASAPAKTSSQGLLRSNLIMESSSESRIASQPKISWTRTSLIMLLAHKSYKKTTNGKLPLMAGHCDQISALDVILVMDREIHSLVRQAIV